MADPTPEEVEQDLRALMPPKRKRRAPAEVELGTDEQPHVRGVMLVRDRDGWRAVEVAIEEHALRGVTTRQSDPDMAAVAVSVAEKWLSEILGDERRRQENGARTDGELTPKLARAELEVVGAELRSAFWADAISPEEAGRALIHFAATGKLEPESIGRKPTGDDRRRLQQLAALAGGWE